MATLLVLEDVHFAYPGDAHEALRGVSLEVRRGEHVCILGGNGSGKSTLVQLLNALLLPTAGRVRAFGLDSAEGNNALAIRRRAAMVFQHPEDQMVTSIVADDIAFGPENLGIPQPEIERRVDTALEAVGMAALAQADPADLSGGQKQRVAIAGALAMEPEVLLLDEPSAMLDTEGRHAIQQIIERLNAQGITIVHITHFMDDALRADRVIVMDEGRVALDGTPDEVFACRERVRELGLEMPFALQLCEQLEARGFALPHTADAEELADALAGELAEGLAGTAETEEATAAEEAAAETTAKAQGETDAPQTEALVEAMNSASAACPRPQPTDVPAIAFEHVSFSYAHATSARKRTRRVFGHGRRAESRVLHPEDLAVCDLSFTVEHGSLTALVGHTGSGKSTTVELTCALKVPFAGTVRVGGIDTADLSRRRELRQLVGYVSQLPERQLFAETVREDIAFGPRNLGLSSTDIDARTREALESVGLPATDDFLARSPFALSGGQQRGVALAGILAMRPRILVLDEPMAGLDPAGRAQIRALLMRLKHAGTTLLLVTHNMDDVAELADQVLVLDRGRLAAQGTPAEVFAGSWNGRGGQGATDDDALQTVGKPSALGFARMLQARGIELPCAPLTLDDLVEEVTRYGAAR